MSNTLFLSIILFISKYFLIFSSTEEQIQKPKSWTVMELYQYLNETYLHKNNRNYQKNINYMIFDPETYLKNGEINEAYNTMQTLFEKYNISTYIFFISQINDKHKKESDEVYESFVDKLNYLIYRDHEDYNENMTLTVVFFINDRKMRFRTPQHLRKIYTDSDAMNILNNRKWDLRNSNFKEVANGIAKDIIKTYIRKTEGGHNYRVLIFTIIFIIGITILIYLLNRKQTSKQEDKVKEFLDKLKKRNNPKEIFSESCIICLDDFKSKEEIQKIEKSGNKELFEKEEISILECGHKFHRKCIADWLKKDQSCPFCRMKFDIKGNDSNKSTNVNFTNFLNEILNIQSDRNLLNRIEVRRIRNEYSRSFRSTNNWNTSGNNNSSWSFPSHSSSSHSHSKSHSSFNKGSGGATSGW